MKGRRIMIAILVAALSVTILPRCVVAKTAKMKNTDTEKIIPLYSELFFETGIESWKLQYTFSDEEVAEVTPDGRIKATMPGKTTIWIKEKGSRKKAYTIHLTVRKPKGYFISEPGNYFRYQKKINLKAAKGYTVYYTTDFHFRTNQKIQSGKTKSIVFSTSKLLKVYAVKKRGKKKVTKAFLNRIGKSNRHYGEYNYYYMPPCGTDLLIQSGRYYPTSSPKPSPQSTAAAGKPTMMPSGPPASTMMPSEQPHPTIIGPEEPQSNI